MSGLDLGLVYNRMIGDVSLSLDANVTWLNDYTIYPFEGGAPIQFDGHIGGGNGGYPKWRGYGVITRSEEHTSELQSLMRISYAVFCLKKKTTDNQRATNIYNTL